MSAFLDAVSTGDLESVKRLVSEGADVKETNFPGGYTPFLWAASRGHIPIMHWLLTEGGSSLAEQTTSGVHVWLLAVYRGNFATLQYLFEEHGGPRTESGTRDDTLWSKLWVHCSGGDAAGLSSLLKVMVMLDDAPAGFADDALPQHADICTRGRQLRTQLPYFLEQQRATVVAQCPLPAVLQSLVVAYAITTPEDMWVDGLT
jgi:hypothetical protein